MPVFATIQDAVAAYQAGTQANAQKWEQRTQAAASEWEAQAKSPATESFWSRRVIDAANRQARLRGLQNVTAQDFGASVAGRGAAYQSGTAAKVGKYQKNFEPYLAELTRIVAGLPPKTTNVRENVINQVVPIAEGLRRLKEGTRGGRAGLGVRR